MVSFAFSLITGQVDFYVLPLLTLYRRALQSQIVIPFPVLFLIGSFFLYIIDPNMFHERLKRISTLEYSSFHTICWLQVPFYYFQLMSVPNFFGYIIVRFDLINRCLTE